MILAHGNMIDNKYKLQIIGNNKLTLNSSIISEKIIECQEKGLQSFGLIESCYSGNFDTSGFNVAITATDSITEGNSGLLQEAINVILEKTSFCPQEILELVTDEKSHIVNIGLHGNPC